MICRSRASHRRDSQGDRRYRESKHKSGRADTLEIADAQVGDDGTDEVDDEAAARYDTNRW